MEEDEKTEFKRQLTKECLKTVVAFSNTKGGTLFIGVDDDGSIVGIDNPDSVSLDLIHMLTDAIRPDITMTSYTSHVVIDEKDIIKVDVQEGSSKPYYLREKGLCPEGVYIRKGPSSIPAPESLILRMIKECSESFESSISLEQNLTFNETKEIFKESGVQLEENQMITLGFYKGKLYTNLAYLLSDQCTSGIKIAAYSDHFKTKFLNRTEIKGSILKQSIDALKFIEPYNPLSSVINGLKRVDIRAYPESSLREAIVNAVVHRDYSVNSDTLISIYGDGISISSYGGLKKDLDYVDLFAGMSSTRNPKIMAIFYRLGFVEGYGTGIPRIMGDYNKTMFKPKFELTPNVFKVELPAITEDTTNLAYMTEVNQIVRYAEEHDNFTRSEIEEIISQSRSKTNHILSAMVDKGMLTIVGGGRGTKYKLCK